MPLERARPRAQRFEIAKRFEFLENGRLATLLRPRTARAPAQFETTPQACEPPGILSGGRLHAQRVNWADPRSFIF